MGGERRVLRQDPGLQRAQLGARLDADVLDQPLAGGAVGGERLGLAPVAVERRHQLRPQPLAQRVLADEALEVADQPPVAAERELGLDAQLERRGAQLLEPHDRGLRERRVGDVHQRGAAPLAERARERVHGALGIARQHALALVERALEAPQVEAVARAPAARSRARA